jgi:hypothetical protein
VLGRGNNLPERAFAVLKDAGNAGRAIVATVNRAYLAWICYSLISAAACVADPTMMGKPGQIDVMASGTAGKPANEGDAGNQGTLPRRKPGAGDAPADSTGGGGAKPDPRDAGDDASAAGATGAAGTGAAGTGGAGTGGSAGAAGATGAAGRTGAAGAAATDAGAPEVVPVSTNPCDRANWTFVASVVCTTGCASMTDSMKLPPNAIDGDAATRYTTGIGQGSKGPEVVILNFAKPVTLTGINLLSKNGDGPVGYVVEHSLDGANFSYFGSGAAGVGSDNLTVTFPATRMLALRITQTGVKPTNWWSIHELTVLGCVPAP